MVYALTIPCRLPSPTPFVSPLLRNQRTIPIETQYATSSAGRPAYDSSAHKMIDVSFQFWHDIFVCTDETLCRFCVCGNARRRIRNSLGTATPSGVLSIYHDVPPERTTCHLGRQKEKARRHLAIALQLLRKCYLFPVPVMALRN